MIWVIAGTADARSVVEALVDAGHGVIATTATEYGADRLAPRPGLERLFGRLDPVAMADLVSRRGVRLVVDASHPHAVQVSHNAIAAARETRVPYLRFERPAAAVERVRVVPGYREAAGALAESDGPVLLAIGSRNLDAFAALAPGRCWARVLPTRESMDACARAGFGPDRIIALQGPFSRAFNRALYDELGIRWLVSKESGGEGGVLEKVGAARDAGIGVIMVARPEIDYPESTGDIGTLVTRVGEVLGG